MKYARIGEKILKNILRGARRIYARVFVGQICQDAIIRWSTILASPKFPIAPPAPPSCFIFNAK